MRRSLLIENGFRESPFSPVLGTISDQTVAWDPILLLSFLYGKLPRSHPSSEKCEGKLPLKKLVSTTTPWIRPGRPRRTTHQSYPGVLRRRVSQPSIHLPRLVYFPSIKIGFEG